VVKVWCFQQGAYLLAGISRRRLPVYGKAATGCFKYIHYYTQHGSFTAAIWAEYTKHAACRHGKRYIFKGMYTAVKFCNAVKG